MDRNRAGSGDEQTGPNGPNVTQNPFDPAALLGYSPYAAALSSSSTGVFPHMSSAFSLFPPPTAMFPTSSSLQFGGLGSLADGLLSSATPALDSATGGTDWWRMAAARAQLAADPSSSASFFAPGVAGGLGSPLLGSVFSGLVPTTSSSATVSSPATITQSSPTSSTTSYTDPSARQYASPSTPVSATAARRSKTSTPVQKVKNEARLSRDSDAVPRRSTGRHDSLSSTSSVDRLEHAPTSSTSGMKSQTDCPSLESSLLSAEAAMYASSSLFFPFALPHLFGSSTAALPFPGLVAPASSSALDDAYSPPSLLPPPPSSDDRAPSHGSSSKTSASSPHVAASPSRSRQPRGSRDGERPESRGARTGRSVIVSPTSSVTSDPDLQPPVLPSSLTARSSTDRKPRDVVGGTWCPSQLGSTIHQSPPHKLQQERGGLSSPRHCRQGDASPARQSSTSHDDDLTFSDVGAMDLSMKKPRRSSPSPAKPPPPPPAPPPPCPSVSKPSTLTDAVSDEAMTDALCMLLSSQQATYSTAEQVALAQLIAGQQLAASGSELPLSIAAAAAATAGLFPPVFDGMSSLFYPPSVLAALAATAQCSTSTDAHAGLADKSLSSGGATTHRRSRGRRRGGRGGRNSSVFISSLFPQQSTSTGARLGDDVKPGRGRGARGRQTRGRGRQRAAEPLSMAYMELDNQRRQYMEQMLQQHFGQVDQQTTTTATPAVAAAGVSGKDVGQSLSRTTRSFKTSRTASSRSQQRSSLTTKLLHHQSKLEQALTSGSAPGEAVLSGGAVDATQNLAAGIESGGGAALMSNFAALATGSRQISSAASLPNDSDADAGNEETSSACSTESDDGQSTRGSDASHAGYSGGTNKRKQDIVNDMPVKKRRRTILDESVLRIPLDRGWQRETRVRSFTLRNIIGEVLYITPCERKLRNYNEVDKFLEKGGISQLCRENFTFSTKVNIGRFYEQQTTSDEGSQWVLLTDAEVKERFVVIEERKKRIIENKLRAQMREEKRQKSEELLSKLAEARMQRKLEQQEMARKVAEMKMRKKAEKEQQREMLHRARQLRVMEVRRMKERQKLARQQERYHRQLQLRMERELRSRQITEEKEVRRQQDVALKEQERERRRLDMLMAKALESRKKEEEKERLKAERRNAKKLDKEKKLAQKRLELFLAREQRRPVEDMSIQDAKLLPEFHRIPGVRLSGKAFADCLMVVEFVHNFASILGFDADSIPTVNMLQGGLLNDDGYLREFFLFVKRLLKCATTDPGFINPKEGFLMSGQKVVDMDVPENGISEVLRLFIKSRSGHEDEMSRWLLLTPFYALNPTQKAAILAFVCNELLCNKDVNAEIEKNIETVNNLRRDKYIGEGKLKKLRMLQAQRQRKTAQKSATHTPSASLPASSAPSEDGASTQNGTTVETSSTQVVPDTDVDSDSDMPTRQPSVATASHDSDTEEDKKASVEDLEAKIEKLVKQQNQMRERVFTLSHKLSAMSFGQDRYRRRYWVLPKCGGIFVEGLESGEPESADPNALETDKKTEESVGKDQCFKQVTSRNVEEIVVKAEQVETSCTPTDIDTDGFTVQPPVSNDEHCPQLPVCYKMNVKSDDDKAESLVIKQENENAESNSRSTLKAELVSLNCLIGNDVKINGDVSVMDCKNGFVDLKNCIRSDGDCMKKIEPLSVPKPSETASDTKQNSLTDDHYMGVRKQLPAVDTQLMAVNPPESATDDSIQSSLCCKPDDDQLPRTPGKDDYSLLQHSTVLQLAVSNAGLTQFAVANSQSYSIASSQRTSQVATPSSEVSAGMQLDLSAAGTPVSFMQPSRTSTPAYLSTSFADDFQLSVDGELQPDFLAIPQNVEPISLVKQRGWWRITNPDTVKELLSCLTMRGIRERSLQKNLERYLNYACQLCSKSKKSILKLEVTEESKRIASTPTSAPSPDDNDSWDFELQRQTEMHILEEIENLEERISSASLQSKGWRMEEAASSDKSISLISNAERLMMPQQQQYIINIARCRLQSLERNIERRYLKPPLGRSNQINLANLSGGCSSKENPSLTSSDDESDTDDETATRDLNSWRYAVSNATSAAQLSIYIAQLVRCIAWEKSIMKVLCQLCCRDDNEAQLLLCDICDRGYHTYCIKPKLDVIPDGDWYCYECISKASGDQCCIACGRHGGRFVACEFCSRRVHLDCLEPPISRMPKKWTCYTCADERGKRKRSRPSTATNTPVKDGSSDVNAAVKNSEEATSNTEEEASQPSVAETCQPTSADEQTVTDSGTFSAATPPAAVKEKPSKTSKDRSDRKRERRKERRSESGSPAVPPPDRASPVCNGTVADDMNVCKAILSELREHSEAWPFLTPVNTKQFPTYRKVIRCPVDFQTIGRKLKTNTYKTHDEFSADVRLVFANCEMFNEDDSQVGQAGHLMKQFFESRWAELTGSGPPPPASLPS